MSYYGAPGSYGAPPGYGGYPPQSSSPPGMAPGMGGPPPGMNQGQHPLPARPGGGYPSNFQMPPNMPKFDMNASVIRLGTTGPQKNDMGGMGSSGAGGQRGVGGSGNEPPNNRRGLGMDRNLEQQRQQIRESMQALLPPKTDEVLKTIFVGNITEGCAGDAGIEDILRSAGSLRKWTRAIDADNKPCTFGFAEYEDSESLETAAEILREVYVPVKKQHPGKKEGEGDEENGDGEVEKTKLLVVVDDASKEYAENWAQQRGDTEDDKQFRFDGAREALNNVLARLFHPTEEQDFDGDVAMQDTAQAQDPLTGEVITIPIAQAEDELSDIPAEMRETVAAEIAAFRDRSNRRDLERLKREEEIEARDRHGGRTTSSSIPTGPGSANGIPVGPKGVHGAPSGPKGLRGVQIPKDYQNGVSFTNGSSELDKYLAKLSDDDTDASDGELERRRRSKKEAEDEKAFLDYERRWLNRERARSAALERERKKDEADTRRTEDSRINMARTLKDWNDDQEASRKTSEYYIDRASWVKHRANFRSRETQADAADRRDEDNERRALLSANEQARGMADEFLDRQAAELGARGIDTVQQKPAFKISLGAAAQKAREAAEAPKRKAAADVEMLLDADEAGGAGADAKRTLVPISFDTAAEAASLTEEERSEARRQLAFSIPQDRDGLFAWDVKWAHLTAETIDDRLKPFVEKRSMEYLGVVEELMWDVVRKTLEANEGPDRLVEELEGLLEDETEGFVKKLWRMVVFYSESEARGLSVEGAA